ncbi:trans-sialidase, partial [Trypanosoma conorhini]
LLTTPVYSEEEGKEKGRLHLWLTDNSRVHDVGPVSAAGDDAAASSLLYRSGAPEEELILLYEKKNGDSYGLVSLSLAKQLEQIKSVVQSWTALDTALQGCDTSGDLDPRETGLCNGPVPTKGLVGLLSNTLAGTAWVDEYRGVNATMKGGAATSEKGGVTFSGAGAGAEWPVGSRGQNQPYYFANNGFTLVASVMIHTVPEEDTPLLGVRMNDAASTVLLGVTYTQDKKWKVTVGGDIRELSEEDATWETEKTYQVALQMGTGDELFVYVDGDEVYDGEDSAVAVGKLFTPHRISHFYFGDGSAAAGTSAGPHVTVANTLLYNEALTGEEIRKLAGSKVALGGPSAGKESRELQAAPSVPTSEGGEPVPEVGPEGGGGEQQTEDGGGTEGPQEKNGGSAGGPPHAAGPPTVEGEQSHEAEAESAGDPALQEDVVEALGPGAAPPSSEVEVASEPAGDLPLSPPRGPTPRRRRRGRGRGRESAASVIAGGWQRGRRRVNTS